MHSPGPAARGTAAAGAEGPAWPWHHAAMTDQTERYDRIAEGYATWWSPVHRPGTLALLDEVDAELASGARRLLDVGCGTGTLAAAAASRWPAVDIDAVDASGGMLAIAERVRAALEPAAARRIRLAQAVADRLPFEDGSFDVVVSAFVLQLVPSRARALREMRRVLRPGGRLAYVTWLRGGPPFAADDAFDDALEAVGLEPRYRDAGDHDDVASPAAAVAQLRRAGIAQARARAASLFTPVQRGWDTLGFLARFDGRTFRVPRPGCGHAGRRAARSPAQGCPRRLRLVLPIVHASAGGRGRACGAPFSPRPLPRRTRPARRPRPAPRPRPRQPRPRPRRPARPPPRPAGPGRER